MEVKKNWQRKTVAKRISIKRADQDPKSPYQYRYRHDSEILVEGLTGKIELLIDLDGIADLLATRAAHSKSGKATMMHGLVKAKRVQQTVLTRETIKNPIPANMVEVV